MKSSFLSLLFLSCLLACNSQEILDTNLIPISENKGEFIQHTYYYLEYNEEHEQASWVYYMLTADFINGEGKRKNNFKPNPLVQTETAQLADYKGSGYDRGHLCPAGSMKINQLAMDETFYLSNMSPQVAGFNRGKWKWLEEQVRKWVQIEDTLFVVTGPIFSAEDPVIGDNEVTVPAFYYKVIYDPTKEKKMIAFIMPNQTLAKSIAEYAVTVDEVEFKTGIDFFSVLPDELENELEGKIPHWQF